MNNIEYNFLSFILEKNKKNEAFTQREIAKALNVSLGMLNAIIKKAANTGLIKISKINGKNYKYLLTSEGMKTIYNRSLRYFKNIAKNSYLYKDLIFNILKQAKEKGVMQVILIGKSSIDFIVEYCCTKLNLEYKNILQVLNKDNLNSIKVNFNNLNLINSENENLKVFYLFSENLAEEEAKEILNLLRINNTKIEYETKNLLDFLDTLVISEEF